MKHLLLLGAETVHVQLLAQLAQRARKTPLPFRVTLVAPDRHPMEANLLSGLVAGTHSLAQSSIDLGGLLKSSGVNYLQGHTTHIDAARQIVVVGDGESDRIVEYDGLSVDTEPVMERELMELTLPGAREHALFLRPLQTFPARWDTLQTRAMQQALRVAVIGASATGVELAFALRERLPHCTVTLVCGGVPPAAHCPQAVQQRVLHRLKVCSINVLPQACTAIGADHIMLDHVAKLACDAPVLVLAAQAPRWLASSGLALDEQGLIAVNEFQQSTSHPQVFAPGDVAAHIGALRPKNGADAVRTASNLATNLFALFSGLHLDTYKPPAKVLSFVSCGARFAIVSWGGWSAQGHWVAYWKRWLAWRWTARIKAVR